MTVVFSATLYGWCLVFAGLEPAQDGGYYCGLNSEIQLAGLVNKKICFLVFFQLLEI